MTLELGPKIDDSTSVFEVQRRPTAFKYSPFFTPARMNESKWWAMDGLQFSRNNLTSESVPRLIRSLLPTRVLVWGSAASAGRAGRVGFWYRFGGRFSTGRLSTSIGFSGEFCSSLASWACCRRDLVPAATGTSTLAVTYFQITSSRQRKMKTTKIHS
ncbi:hypothetical protein AGABI1DRAFT_114883 [Agaricus bisporus var. burnettii JB137-S8]|uniref:Uncharacterized protein n=1 Tax=Agaricus bisporus var. burnettii (strain JB137-S8 / ATCC MYA-4627 / FGSC 10392) TaxID=597362 RepID=K5WRM8_AGABU|nr:uncharacterized protein AGABI1DRAFT_114883 [Agaricus bisporus var. burnettii JB137-S8]EKM78046.1 hypothetical protein AGABI1DRAFT_114883 [Agaricus bisporus var. burnettii JB137-S8]